MLDPVPHARAAFRCACHDLLLFALIQAVVLGCAPPATLRPIGGLPPDRRAEVGAAFAGVGPRPYAVEPWRGVGQAWGTLRITRALDLSAITAFDTSAFALGGAARLSFLQSSRVALGVEAEGGWLWTALALPLSLRIVDELRIYTAPRIGTFGSYWTPGVPLGVSIPVASGFVLRAEGQLSWADFKYYNRRVLAAAALVYQFPEGERAGSSNSAITGK
jgi:hypothetical protein